MKINRLTFAVMAISIAFTACSATARETVGNSGSVVVADDGEYVVDKTLDLKDFHGINSFSMSTCVTRRAIHIRLPYVRRRLYTTRLSLRLKMGY